LHFLRVRRLGPEIATKYFTRVVHTSIIATFEGLLLLVTASQRRLRAIKVVEEERHALLLENCRRYIFCELLEVLKNSLIFVDLDSYAAFEQVFNIFSVAIGGLLIKVLTDCHVLGILILMTCNTLITSNILSQLLFIIHCRYNQQRV